MCVVITLLHLNIPSSLVSCPFLEKCRTWNGNDFTTHIDFGKFKKLLFSQYKKLLFFVLPPLVIQSGGSNFGCSARLPFGGSPVDRISTDVSKSFCFFHFLFCLYQIHFSKKKNLRKVVFWMLPKITKMSFWTVVVSNIMQFSMDISVMYNGKYSKLGLTGEICRPWRGRSGLERIYVEGLEITYLLMYFWTRSHPPRSRTKWCNGTPLSVLGPYCQLLKWRKKTFSEIKKMHLFYFLYFRKCIIKKMHFMNFIFTSPWWNISHISFHFISFHFICSWRPFTSPHFISLAGEMSIWWVWWVSSWSASVSSFFWAGQERNCGFETIKHARLRPHRQCRDSQLLLLQKLPLHHVQ